MSSQDTSKPSQKAASLAAFIIYRPTESEFRIGGVSLLDRQIITLHRSGCGPITIITPSSIPSPPRAQRLSIPIQIAPSIPTENQACVVVDGDAYFESTDLQRLILGIGPIETKQGKILHALRLDRPQDWPTSFDSIVAAPKQKTRAKNLSSQKEATALGNQLLRNTTSNSDGLVDRFFNRPISRYLTRRLLEINISPNLISMVAIATGLLAALFLAIPRHAFAILGALLFQFSAILDCCDGDVARLHFKESILGKWLDIVGDQIVHIAIFVGIGFGLINATPSLAITLLTASAVIGAILAFATFLWASKRSAKDPRVERFLRTTANRDFSVVVLCLAILGRLEIFAVLVGIGIHAYWISLLLVSLRGSNQAKA